jgi:SAM-dependent methyltransferase
MAELITAAYAEHGSVALTLAAAYVAMLSATVFTASRWFDAVLDRLTFDRRHGVDTAPPSSVLGRLLSRRLRRRAPVAVRTIRSILNALEDQIRGFEFVDIGSGKGRAILIASEFPFQKIVGIERAHDLADAARQNLRAYRNAARRCADVDIREMDARDYAIPEGDCVLFLHDPAGRKLLAAFAGKIRAACAARRHRLYVVYVSPRHSSVFDDIPCLSRITPPSANTDYFEIYRYVPVADAQTKFDRGLLAA